MALKALYKRLPLPLRSVAASGYGYVLRARRYGEDTERLVEEALARERWSPDEWRSWQQTRLVQLLDHAATAVPYYRDHWRGRRQRGDFSAWTQLENWPLLTKAVLRDCQERFVADTTPRYKRSALSTSGTTGTPLRLWRDQYASQMWYALFEARWRRWHGVSRHDRWAILGGRAVVPVERQHPPFWIWNAGLKQLYLSGFHLSAATAASYLEAIARFRAVYLWGYASSMYTLAYHVLQQGLEPPPLKVIFSNAEKLYPHQRQTLERAFGCRVVDTYGMAEAVMGAGECAAGRMHLWPDAGVVEVVRDDRDEPVPPEGVGRLVFTGLTNWTMPLIRYEVGDRGAVAVGGSPCPCGRTLPVFGTIEGRIVDNVVTPDGRSIYAFGGIYQGLPVQEAQIVQRRRETLEILVVPAPSFTDADARAIVARVRERVGDMQIEVRTVASIPRTANGKFRAIMSEVARDEGFSARP